MITRADIKGNYDKEKALMIYREVKEIGNFLGFCRKYLHDESDNVSRNALCGIAKATNKEIQQLKPMLDELIDVSMQTESSSVRRVVLSIIERVKFTEADIRADFLDYCFARIIDTKEFPAVQALCLKLANKMCQFYPDLLDELHRTLESMELSYYSPAIKSVMRNIK